MVIFLVIMSVFCTDGKYAPINDHLVEDFGCFDAKQAYTAAFPFLINVR